MKWEQRLLCCVGDVYSFTWTDDCEVLLEADAGRVDGEQDLVHHRLAEPRALAVLAVGPHPVRPWLAAIVGGGGGGGGGGGWPLLRALHWHLCHRR